MQFLYFLLVLKKIQIILKSIFVFSTLKMKNGKSDKGLVVKQTQNIKLINERNAKIQSVGIDWLETSDIKTKTSNHKKF